jgi:peptide/nickel transport system substrate-binding protein
MKRFKVFLKFVLIGMLAVPFSACKPVTMPVASVVAELDAVAGASKYPLAPPQRIGPLRSGVEEVEVSSTPKRGGRLIIGLDDMILTLDPADYSHRQTETVVRNIFDGLVTRTLNGQVVPQIAESYIWLNDRTLKFELKRNIQFHNGEDLTAEDVVFTFTRLMAEDGIKYPEPHTSPRKGLLGPLERVTPMGSHTVYFFFEFPYPVALQLLVHQHILPKDYFELVGDEGFAQAPVGCGPFEFVSAGAATLVEDAAPQVIETVALKRFGEYYGGARELPPVGPAFLERLVFRAIPDSAARVAALQAGEVDIIQSVPSYLSPVLEADPDIAVKTVSGTRPYWMEMNVNRAPFDDVRVRQAMNYAVDASLIVGTFLNGRGTVLAGPLSPHNKFADGSLEPYGYNPFLAIDLLREAGYTAEDISFVIDSRVGEREYAEAVAAQLRALGMDVTVQVWEYSELKPLLLTGKRMAYVGGWGDSVFDPVGHFEAKWHTWVNGSGRSDGGYGRGNFSTYSNIEVDALIKAAEVEPDEVKRQQLYNEAQEIIYEEAPAVFLFVPDVVEASTSRVRNWSPSPDGRLNMHDVWLTAGRRSESK